MKCKFITDCENYIEDAGLPWTTVSRKTGISYGRLRNLRTGTVEPSITEFMALGKYCELDLSQTSWKREPPFDLIVRAPPSNSRTSGEMNSPFVTAATPPSRALARQDPT